MLSFRDSLKKVDYLLALLAGASMVLAFAPFELRAFAWFAPAVLFWLNLKNIPRGQRLRLAWVFGIGLFAGVMGGKYGARASTGFAKNLRQAMFENIQTFSFS